MTTADDVMIVVAAVLVAAAACLAMPEAALWRVSRARAEELAQEGRRGAVMLTRVVTDAAAPLNVLLLLRTLCEMVATTLVAVVAQRGFDSAWRAILLAGGVMTVVDYVVVGVGARTLGRQHPDRVGLLTAPTAYFLTKLLGP